MTEHTLTPSTDDNLLSGFIASGLVPDDATEADAYRAAMAIAAVADVLMEADTKQAA